MKGRYKVVFLDWNGTLSVSRFWAHWQKRNKKYQENYKRIAGHLFGSENDRVERWMRAEFSSENICEELGKMFEIDPNKLVAELKFSCEQMELVSPEILFLVKRLQDKGIKVVVATDNMDTFPRWTVPALKLYSFFDEVLDSYSLKTLKVESDELGRSKFFKGFFEKHQIKPEETLLIEDSVTKQRAIESFGINYRPIEYGQLVPKLKEVVEEFE